MQQYRLITILIVVFLVAVVGIALLFRDSDGARQIAAENAVREFGSQLQNVPLAGDAASVREAIETYYSGYVTENLLSSWLDEPSSAPGRETSSPWPARIDVTSSAAQGSGYVVQGNVVLLTSEEVTSEENDNAGLIPVIILVIDQEGEWKIAAYEELESE